MINKLKGDTVYLGQDAAAKAPQAVEPKMLETINERLSVVRSDISGNCARIEQMLHRLSPVPQGVEKGKPEIQPGGMVHRLEMTIDDLGATAKWLNDLANRLERIA